MELLGVRCKNGDSKSDQSIQWMECFNCTNETKHLNALLGKLSSSMSSSRYKFFQLELAKVTDLMRSEWHCDSNVPTLLTIIAIVIACLYILIVINGLINAYDFNDGIKSIKMIIDSFKMVLVLLLFRYIWNYLLVKKVIWQTTQTHHLKIGYPAMERPISKTGDACIVLMVINSIIGIIITSHIMNGSKYSKSTMNDDVFKTAIYDLIILIGMIVIGLFYGIATKLNISKLFSLFQCIIKISKIGSINSIVSIC